MVFRKDRAIGGSGAPANVAAPPGAELAARFPAARGAQARSAPRAAAAAAVNFVQSGAHAWFPVGGAGWLERARA